MEVLAGYAQLGNGYIRGKHCIQCPVEVCQAVLPLDPKTDYLPSGMDSPICSTGTDYASGPPRNRLQSSLQLALYCSPL
jgi:hypothetical protein